MRQHRAHAGRAAPRTCRSAAAGSATPAGGRTWRGAPSPRARPFARLAVEAVGHQQHAGVLPEHAPPQRQLNSRRLAPMRVPPDQSLIASATRAIATSTSRWRSWPRDVGEARAEHEHRDAVAVVGDRVQEVQEHARVRVHRARDVAQHDERRVQLARRRAHQRDHLAALAQGLAQGRSQVDPVAARGAPEPARAASAAAAAAARRASSSPRPARPPTWCRSPCAAAPRARRT